jgi:subtilisin family serine protease/uncharacterized membrane protein
MSLPAHRDRSPSRNRLVRNALATTAAALCVLGIVSVPSPALARDGGSIPDAFAQRRPTGHVDQHRDHVTPDRQFRALSPAVDELSDKLGDRDLRTFQAAEAKGTKTVTVLLAVTPGDTAKVSQAVADLHGSVGRSEDGLGYVRATVPVDAVRGLARLGDVRAIDLNRTYRIPDPRVTLRGSAPATPRGVAGPGATTGAANPYLPVGETGAVSFVDRHRAWDGRGITVGVLDSGVDLDHPALRTTTNGKDKVTDWFTATDPVVDNDGTWLQMDQEVTGPTFNGLGEQWTAPEGDYRFAVFFESTTEGSELGGDVNRDGDTDDWVGVLYDPEDHRIWVDSDLDHDFTDEQVMAPYGVDHQVGHFGVDDHSTPVVERVPFVVDYREDVDLSPLGYEGVADFVNLGIVSAAHGTHVAGIIAGNGLFGGDMQGAAPGAQIVSARACTFSGGCTSTALAEGMIDLVLDDHVDVVNVSIGGLPALNDGSDAIAMLYDSLVDTTGVQIFAAAGNEGPGLNTAGSPSVANRVVSVAASVSKATWRADYGAQVRRPQGIFAFSSRGPSESGGLKPTLAAPGAAISTTPRWLPGDAVPEAGYDLPPGYSMLNGTSMAAPEATGAAALLLSAARATGTRAPAAALRQAMASTADPIKGSRTTAQGTGLVDTEGAWSLLARGVSTRSYTIAAPVCSALSHELGTPDTGTGVYNRCLPSAGGQREGSTRTYAVAVTRTSGPARATSHHLSWIGNDGTFSAPRTVSLRRGSATSIRITAHSVTRGEHSAILRVDDPATHGVDQLVPVTVVATQVPHAPNRMVGQRGSVERGSTTSVFVAVPRGVGSLRLSLDSVAAGRQVRFLAIDPYGVPVDSNAGNHCYTHQVNGSDCDALSRSYEQPVPGVWEIEVEARRTSSALDNPYHLTAELQGLKVTPGTVTIETASIHRPVTSTFSASNAWGPVTVVPTDGLVGRKRDLWSSVAEGQLSQGQVDVSRDATRLEMTIVPRQRDADLDVYLFGRNGLVAQATTTGPGAETLVVRDPQPGTLAIVVAGVDVPSGETEFDYHERAYSRGIGRIAVGPSTAKHLGAGDRIAVHAEITADAESLDGSPLVGRVQMKSLRGAVLGTAEVLIDQVTTPDAQVVANAPAMVGYDLNNAGVMTGDKQIDAQTKPVRWTAEGGVEQLALGDHGTTGYSYDINEHGDSVGQIALDDNRVVPALWKADGTLIELGLPDWLPYDYARAFAINDSGTVVGNASLLRQEDDGFWHEYNDPFIWTEAGGFQRLPHIGDDRSMTEPFAVNDDGWVVGHSVDGGDDHLVLWSPDREIEDLGNLPGMSGGVAAAINADGTVVGTNGDDAFVWTRADGLRRLADYGFSAGASKVTSDGWVMGSAEVAPYEETPVVWDPQGRVYDVHGMVDPSVFYPVQGMGLNDLHQLVVYGYTADGSGLQLLQLPALP